MRRPYKQTCNWSHSAYFDTNFKVSTGGTWSLRGWDTQHHWLPLKHTLNTLFEPDKPICLQYRGSHVPACIALFRPYIRQTQTWHYLQSDWRRQASTTNNIFKKKTLSKEYFLCSLERISNEPWNLRILVASDLAYLLRIECCGGGLDVGGAKKKLRNGQRLVGGVCWRNILCVVSWRRIYANNIRHTSWWPLNYAMVE